MATRTAYYLRRLAPAAAVGLVFIILGYGRAYATGLPSNPKFSPTSMTFGRVLVGTTSPAKTLLITNPNTSALTVTSIRVTAPFGLAGNSCGSSISAGGRCQVSLTFNPTTDINPLATSQTGMVTVVDNGKT